ncbi:hypothetical protein CFC21_023189, partial [Triticum aestivum]
PAPYDCPTRGARSYDERY